MIVYHAGPSARERIWAVIRAQRKELTQSGLATASGTALSLVRNYVQGLLKAGYLRMSGERVGRGVAIERVYVLVRDSGWEAPRVRRSDGQAVSQGSVNDAMWSTMRRLFIHDDFDCRELVALASTTQRPISLNTARTYVTRLAKAGYLTMCASPVRGPGGGLARYRLCKTMDTGPRAPRILRTKVVFDANLACCVGANRPSAGR